VFHSVTGSHELNSDIEYENKPMNLANQLPFDSEAELVKTIEQKFLKQWSKPNSSFFREFDSSNGIADIVFFQMKANYRKHLDIGNVPPRWLYALFHMPYRKIFTIDDMARALGVSKARAKTALRTFISLEYCCTGNKKDTWKKIKQPQLITNKIYAVEAKLSKWNHALSQAIRYLDYANQSWVILDAKGANTAIKNIEKFEKFNIGLATIASSGEITVQFEPETKEAKSEYRLWYSNAEIARILNLSNECENNS